MSILKKDYKKIIVTGTAGIDATAGTPARPGYYTTTQVVEPGLLTEPQQSVPQDIPVTNPPEANNTSKVWPAYQSDQYNWRYASRDEITIMLIGSTYANQAKVRKLVDGSYQMVPKFSMCDIVFMELDLAVRLPYLYEKVPFQMGITGTSDIALAPYTSGGITAPGFCIGTFPDPIDNPAYDPEYDENGFWNAEDTYDCVESNGIVDLTIKGMGGGGR